MQSWDALAKFGYYSPDAIWDGKYWAFITTVFVHMLAFNVYWLWVGGALERTVGRIRWLGFFAVAAIVSSGMQFGISGETGIGASGVIYGMFGFIWVTRRRYVLFSRIASKQTIVVFVAWLLFCVLATISKVMNVGNEAHFAGLLFGAGVGAVFVTKYRVRLVLAGTAVLTIASIVPLFWCPWSVRWVGKQAYAAHMRRDYPQAIRWYERELALGGDPVWTLDNMARAFAAMGDKAKYQETVERLRAIDENAAAELDKQIRDSSGN